MENIKKCDTLHLILLMIFLLKAHIPLSLASETIVYIDPSFSRQTINQQFAITIRVQNVVNLSEWQMEIHFNPTLLACLNVTFPFDNVFGTNILHLPQDIDNVNGQVKARCLLDSNYTFSGSGKLCQINFQAKAPGISFIDIQNEMNYYYGSYLADPSTPEPNLLPFTSADGIIEIGNPAFQEHIYITTLNSTSYLILFYTNSTITNLSYNYSTRQVECTITETENKTILITILIYKILLDAPEAVRINNSPVYALTSRNDTHTIVYFTHTLTTGTVQIRSTVPYDVNGDRIVNMIDLWTIAKAMGTQPNDQNWNPLADVLKDNIINYSDLYTVRLSFGKTWFL